MLIVTIGCQICPAQVTINEVMAENRSTALADGSVSDWVELHNAGSEPVSLSGWSLSDTAANPRRWSFPNNVTVPARSYLVVALDSARPPSTATVFGMNAGFSIKGSGDDLHLYSINGALADTIRFGPQAADFSIGAIPSGSDSFVLCTPTPGSGNLAQVLGSPDSLRINEWMASPSSGEDWFEIYNGSTLPIQLTGLFFTDLNVEPSPVSPLSFVGIGRDGFVRFYADNSTNFNEVNFKLGASGDAIEMHKQSGEGVDRVVFGQQIEDQSEGRLPDGAESVQKLNLATPAESNLVLFEGLAVNEVLAHSDPPFEDAVEFLNLTTSPIDVGGWFLSNQRSELQKYALPPGTVVPASGYLVIYEQQFNAPGSAQAFSFNSAHGDRVVLAQATAGGALTGYIVEAEFESSERYISFGRHPVSVAGESVFVPLEQTTFGVSNPESLAQFRSGQGAANAGPKIGPVVIGEIMYNASTNQSSAESASDPEEYIELTNLGDAPVALYDPAHNENVWRISEGISYSFPRFSSIPARGSILLVSFDPNVDLELAAFFRQKYSVPSSAPIFGPFSGKLSNSGEAVALHRPDEPQGPDKPDAGYVPYILVDRVEYLDGAPWPAEADGSGRSLQKIGLAAFGNDPGSWIAAGPTPGYAGGVTELRITSIHYLNGKVMLSFSGTPGTPYRIEHRADFSSGVMWQTLTNVSGSTTPITVALDAAGRLDFYRVSASQ